MFTLMLMGFMLSPKDNVRLHIDAVIVAEHLSWTTKDATAMVKLCYNESSYKPTAYNRGSKAYGLYQFLPKTWAGTQIAKTSDPYLQTLAAARYIKARYKNPTRALAFWEELHLVNGKWVHYY